MRLPGDMLDGDQIRTLKALHAGYDVRNQGYWVNGVFVPEMSVMRYRRTPDMIEDIARWQWITSSHFRTRFERVL